MHNTSWKHDFADEAKGGQGRKGLAKAGAPPAVRGLRGAPEGEALATGTTAGGGTTAAVKAAQPVLVYLVLTL